MLDDTKNRANESSMESNSADKTTGGISTNKYFSRLLAAPGNYSKSMHIPYTYSNWARISGDINIRTMYTIVMVDIMTLNPM